MGSARDPGPINQGSTPSSIVNNALTSPTRQPIHAASPPRINQGTTVYPNRSSTPDKYKLTQAQTSRPYRSFSGGLEQRPQSFTHSGSPEVAGNGFLQRSSGPQYSPIAATTLQQDYNHYQQGHNKNNDRPSSQPIGTGTSPIEVNARMRLGEVGRQQQQEGTRPVYPDLERSKPEDAIRQYLKGSMDSGGFLNERITSSQENRVNQPEAPRSPKQQRLGGSRQSFSTRTSVDTGTPSSRQRSGTGRSSDRTHNPSHTAQSPFSPETLRRLREERHHLHQQNSNQSQAGHQPRPISNIEERQPEKYPGPPVTFASGLDGPVLLDANEQNQTKEDVIANNRSALALLIENSKRGGRFSPLPQAVQGAQGRTSGPASDPGIKNEFGRMFSGIGSGVGSAGPTGSGTNTPFPPPSPTMSHGPQRRTPLSNRADLPAAPKSRAASKNSRKPRKCKDDESNGNNDIGDSTTLGGASNRANKKGKATHHHHPHHVHQ